MKHTGKQMLKSSQNVSIITDFLALVKLLERSSRLFYEAGPWDRNEPVTSTFRSVV